MSDSGSHEIVIIRRKHDDEEEGHHGGVWKIAFADFMTAMMAFFLVMWLISANEKTRATIARYFNPIKLDEMTPNRKGIRDPKEVEVKPAPDDDKSGTGESKQTPPPNSSQGNESQPSAAQSTSPPTNSKPAAGQVQMPQSPNSAPARAAQNIAARAGNLPQVGIGSSSTGSQAGADDTFRDPFAPSQEIGLQPAPSQPSALRASTSLPKPDASTVVPSNRSLIVDEPSPPSPNSQPVPKTSDSSLPPSSAQPPALPPLPSPSAQAEANQLRTIIASALKDNLSTQPGPALEVKATSEGTLISLMDEASFEMFSVGSARPQAKVAAMMQKVAQILKSHPGRIVIRGHTDGRVYKSGTYDNWRLSADRADMARDMLVVGGLDEKRIERIEGLADRQLKNSNDPNAPENRRIEILIEDARP